MIFPTSEALFMPEGLFEHSPIMLNVHQVKWSRYHPFKYYKMWCTTPEFDNRVREAWEQIFHGIVMFIVMQEQERLKWL